MQPNTNELVDIEKWKEQFPDVPFSELEKQGYKPVPDELQEEASSLLAGNLKTTVPRGHNLDKWASQFRKKKKKSNKAKKLSRRKNRK